ncbi:MAG: PEP-CTERM sorting domain-containing protein [Planctomycetaceae bacterium]
MKKIAVLICIFTTSSMASGDIIWNNGLYDTTGTASDISDFARADNFNLGAATTLNSLRFWAVSTTSPATFGNFGGTVGFAIHQNAAGVPGTTVASGADSTVSLIDTGATVLGLNIFELGVDLGSIALAAGDYWLQLREGSIGSAFDGTSIFWTTTASGSAPTGQFDATETGPVWGNDSGQEYAFELSGTLDSATVPEPSSLAVLFAGGIGAYFVRRRRQNAAA